MNTELYKKAVQWAEKLLDSDCCGYGELRSLIIPINESRIDVYTTGKFLLQEVMCNQCYYEELEIDEDDEFQDLDHQKKIEVLNKLFPNENITVFENPENDCKDEFFIERINDGYNYEISIINRV